jgi:hypothetical protein
MSMKPQPLYSQGESSPTPTRWEAGLVKSRSGGGCEEPSIRNWTPVIQLAVYSLYWLNLSLHEARTGVHLITLVLCRFIFVRERNTYLRSFNYSVAYIPVAKRWLRKQRPLLRNARKNISTVFSMWSASICYKREVWSVVSCQSVVSSVRECVKRGP